MYPNASNHGLPCNVRKSHIGIPCHLPQPSTHTHTTPRPAPPPPALGPWTAGDRPHLQGAPGLHRENSRHHQRVCTGGSRASQCTQAAALPAVPTRWAGLRVWGLGRASAKEFRRISWKLWRRWQLTDSSAAGQFGKDVLPLQHSCLQ
jgi:hypothetical protein